MLALGYKEAVKAIRRRKGMTQKQCALASGMGEKMWSKYETGAATITDAALAKMRDALGATDTELWNLALPHQRAHHHDRGEEIREDTQAFGTTPAAIRQVQRLLALDDKALPAGQQHWFRAERSSLAALLTNALAMADNLEEKYLYDIGKARRAQDAEDDKNR